MFLCDEGYAQKTKVSLYFLAPCRMSHKLGCHISSLIDSLTYQRKFKKFSTDIEYKAKQSKTKYALLLLR